MKLKDFLDKWVGSTERAIWTHLPFVAGAGRCYVFVFRPAQINNQPVDVSWRFHSGRNRATIRK